MRTGNQAEPPSSAAPLGRAGLPPLGVLGGTGLDLVPPPHPLIESSALRSWGCKKRSLASLKTARQRPGAGPPGVPRPSAAYKREERRGAEAALQLKKQTCETEPAPPTSPSLPH